MEHRNHAAVDLETQPPNPPNDGILFVDHSRTGRSGHLGADEIKGHFVL